MRGRGLKLGADNTQKVIKLSPPMRGRGLKLEQARIDYGRQEVAPHAGAWIETSGQLCKPLKCLCRPPCWGVD